MITRRKIRGNRYTFVVLMQYQYEENHLLFKLLPWLFPSNRGTARRGDQELFFEWRRLQKALLGCGAEHCSQDVPTYMFTKSLLYSALHDLRVKFFI